MASSSDAASVARRAVFAQPLPGAADGAAAAPKALVVVLLGWWGSTDNALSKFAQLYLDRGISVLRFTAHGGETFRGADRRSSVAAALLDEVERTSCVAGGEHPQLLFHMMSNNGASLYTSMMECAQQRGKYQWVIGATRGVVYDCAPGNLTLPVFVKAFLATRPPLSLRLGLLVPPSALLLLLLWAVRRWPVRAALALLAVGGSLWRGGSNNYNEEYHHKLASDPTTCPQLFLYSSGDALVSHEAVECLIEQRRRRSVEVMAQRFEGVPHMELLRHRRPEYEEALDKYLQLLGLLSARS
mmetsp:Transcript_101202/g.325134  ORF Transcript_101202/g.325134 Transcript_101202/m.325134 type:complete len:300 (-) Transcript_101202:61-960(-)